MLRNADFKHQTYIGKTGVAYGSGVTNGDKVTKETLADGAIAIVDLSMTLLDPVPASVAGKYRIVQGRGATEPLAIGPIIDGSVTTASAKDGAVPVQQVTTLSLSDASTWEIPASTQYYLFIEKQDNDDMNRSGYYPSITADYKTTSDDTASTNAARAARLFTGLGQALQQNLLFEPDNKYMRVAVDLVGTDAAVANATGFDATYGTNVVTVTGATTPTIADTDVITFLGNDSYTVVGTPVATGTAADVYVTLDAPYRGSTVTGGAIPELTTTITGAQLILTGVSNPFDVTFQRDFYTNRFDVRLMTGDEPVSEVSITKTTGASEGVGAWESVAMDEYLSWGFLGQGREIVATPPGSRPATVVEGANYSIISLREKNQIPSFLNTSNSSMSHLIYIETASAGTVDTQGIDLATAFGVTLAS